MVGTMADLEPKLRSEIASLMRYIQRLRLELAAVSRRENEMNEFETMSDQLDAIVEATESATETILQAVETISALAGDLRGEEDASAREELCDRIQSEATRAMEACSFQDITGQRVTKIVRSVKFVESRVNSMAELCGRETIESLAAEVADESAPAPDDESALLQGPQRADQAISQEEIDKLFE